MKSQNQLPGNSKAEKDYFHSLQTQSIINPQHLQYTNNLQLQSRERCISEIQSGSLKIQEERSLKELFNKRKNKLDIKDQLVRKEKLEQALKMKQELEKKLNLLDFNIDEIKSYQKKEDRKKHLSSIGGHNKDGNLHETPEQKLEIQRKMKALVKDRDEREERRKRRIEEEKEQKRKHEEEEKQRIEQMKQEKHLRKKSELEEKYKQMQLRQKEKLIERKEQEIVIKQILSKKPKYVENTEKYNDQEKKLLQQKKQQLSNIRNLHKPIDKDEIQEHQRQYEQFKKEKQQRYQQNQMDTKFNYQKPYQSENYKRFQDELKEIKKQAEESTKKPNPVRLKKIKEYSQKIEKPQINPKLVQERERNIENSKTRSILDQVPQNQLQAIQNNGNTKLRAQSLKEIGNDYLRYAKQKCKKKDPNADESEEEYDDQSVQQYTDDKVTLKKNDYIEEMRKKRMQHEKDDKSKGLSNYEKIVTNHHYNNEDKEIIMLMESERLRDLAERKERLLKVQGKKKAIGTEEDQLVDEYLMKSVQAKIAILKLDEGTKKNDGNESD